MLRRPHNMNFLVCHLRVAFPSCRSLPLSLLRCVVALGWLIVAVVGAKPESNEPTGRLITSAGIAINSQMHKVYAVDEGEGAVVVTDEHTGSRKSVKVGGAPIAIAINRATNKIYVVNTGSDSISVIDGEHDTVVA